MTKKKTSNVIIFCILCVLVVAFLTPIFFVLINSFKGKLFISNNPFALPTAETFAGLTNYVNGIEKTGFFTAFGWSAFITVFSVAAIILFTSMTAYYLTRVKTGVTNVLYYMFVFSMIVPFQMVMFTMSKLANMTHLNNPPGMVLLYLFYRYLCGFYYNATLSYPRARYNNISFSIYDEHFESLYSNDDCYLFRHSIGQFCTKPYHFSIKRI